MGMDAASEVQKALGYAGGGALLLKIVDSLLKWRGMSHADPTAELTATLSTGAELREELRKEAERLRSERDRLMAEVEKSEGEIATLRLQVAALKVEVEDLRAELRLLRRTARDMGDSR